ncbi:unnamed protein product [Parascedosporium putredinis]|uniref:WHIM1 domain-containing protein n=1 Tax=Parascedosporium putredinis TaxID=1442378 RepID=A0A9P1MFD7_9PEZI|nr:unnamed protein product [Parascedosporium putredinis]CAI8003254.1 unnamed protein product [Parascedosporium putredinis]
MGGEEPLSGGGTFASMTPTERLTLLRALILWAMASSESLRTILAKAYKQNRHEDDLNQPMSVQPWGADSDKRRYYLIEGRDHTSFRVYRESNPAGFKRTWWSVADDIDNLTALANKLENDDGGPKAKRLSQGIHQAIPRLMESEEKRRRREYRQRTKERFRRPEVGFSLYEGRTRGKRIKYTFSDEEDDIYSDQNVRRSSRNTATAAPVAESVSVTTQSGRQVRPTRLNPNVGSAGGSVQGDTSDGDLVGANGRPRRGAAANGWANTRDDEHVPEESNDEEDEFNDEELLEEDLDVDASKSLVVKLSVGKSKLMGSRVVMSDAPGAPVAEDTAKTERLLTPEPTVKGDSEPAGSVPNSSGLVSTPLALRGAPRRLRPARDLCEQSSWNDDDG